jgi:hypothetical protein
MHCQNAGKMMELQQQQHCKFGLGLDRFQLNLVGKFNFAILFEHFHRADVFQISALQQ